jgi:hypothetical protein
MLVQESYDRAYRSVVTLQQLTELEEIIAWKSHAVLCTSPDARTHGEVLLLQR